MKQKFLAFVVLMTSISTSLLAQTTPLTKIGYTNVDVILMQLPEAKKMQNELEVAKAQFDKAIGETYKEFQEKYEAYQKNGPNMTDVIRADKEKELQSLQGRVEEMQKNAQTSLQTKQQQLMEPILTKVNNAIQEVGKENGYLYILNMDAGANTTPIILYAGSEEYAVTNLILKKLGVDPEKAAAAPATAPAATKPAGTAPAATTPAATTPKKK